QCPKFVINDWLTHLLGPSVTMAKVNRMLKKLTALGLFLKPSLNEHWFTTLAHARAVIAAWRQDYNEQRPHSALNYLAPSEFAAKHRATADAPAAFQELV
ncbi:transposase, partial [Burkholderia multivorans]|nr:transposase [Burkholderia multivorans]